MTSSINKNFFGLYQSEIAHTVMIAPICFEVGHFLYKVGSQKDSLKHLKNRAVHLFKQDSNESTKEFRKRQLKVLFKTSITIATVVAIIFGLPMLSYIYTASIALSLVSTIAKAYVHRKEAYESLKNLKNKIIKTYSLKNASSPAERKKIIRNYIISFIALSVFGASTLALFSLLHPLVAAPSLLVGSLAIIHFVKSCNKIFQKQVDKTNMQRNLSAAFHLTLLSALIISAILLPELSSQVKKCLAQIEKGETWVSFESSFKIIYLEYITMGLMHVAYSFHYLAKGNKKLALFHFSNSLVAFLAPFGRVGEDNSRLHHDFSGLVLSLAPFRSIKLLGAGYTFDSLIYYVDSDRSYLKHSSYDFVNVAIEYSLFSYIILSSAIQKTSQNILAIINKKRKDHEEENARGILASLKNSASELVNYLSFSK